MSRVTRSSGGATTTPLNVPAPVPVLPDERSYEWLGDARTAQEQGRMPPRVYGYTFANRGVWFEYELNEETNLVTDDRTGSRYRSDPKIEVTAAVAGDFSGWKHIEMRRHPRVGNLFGVHLPRMDFPLDRHEFKFVLNDHLWVEPPAFASNTAPAGVGDANTLNLLIVLEREAKA